MTTNNAIMNGPARARPAQDQMSADFTQGPEGDLGRLTLDQLERMRTRMTARLAQIEGRIAWVRLGVPVAEPE